MLYAISFLLLFAIGGLTGIFLGALSTDVHLTDTYFVVAHFHYVMMGGTVIAFLGGLHYWWPKMTGRMYNERLGQIGAVIVFIGFNMHLLPAVHHGRPGHAAPLLQLSGPVPADARVLDGRLLDSGARAFPDRCSTCWPRSASPLMRRTIPGAARPWSG